MELVQQCQWNPHGDAVCLVGGICSIVVSGKPASFDEASTASQDSTTSASESLPPDTFRKLAQALYQRGDKASNRLQRKFFYNDSVTCNDGSVAGFYIRRNYKSKRWITQLIKKLWNISWDLWEQKRSRSLR